MHSIYIATQNSPIALTNVSLDQLCSTGAKLYQDAKTVVASNLANVGPLLKNIAALHSAKNRYSIEQVNAYTMFDIVEKDYTSRHASRLSFIDQCGAIGIPSSISTADDFYQWILQNSR